MKKTISILISLILACSFVLAQARGIHEPGTGLQGNETPEPRLLSEGAGDEMPEPTLISAGQERQRIRAGDYQTEGGQMLQIMEQERTRLRVGGVEANTRMELMQEQVQERTRLHVMLSNGRDSEIKIMPDTASETAISRLRMKMCNSDNNCSIELKEVGAGDGIRAAYELRSQKQSKLFGLFRKEMRVNAQIDAESGEVISAKKPWWAFLASE